MKTFKDYVNEELLSDISDEKERSIVLNLTRKIGDGMDAFVNDRIKSGVAEELADRGFTPRPMRDHDRKYNRMLQAWRSNGHLSDHPGVRVTVQDMIKADKQRLGDAAGGKLKREDYAFSDGAFYWDNPMLIPRVFATLVREPAEIVQTLSPLFTKIRFDGPGQSIAFPAVSSYAAGDLDISEGGRYPEGMLEFGATITATIGKSGIKVRFTEEMLKWSLFDVMAMHLRAAGVALARWKEQKCADAVNALGTVHFDNASGSTAHTTGRGSDLLFNGTFTMQDLHAMYAAGLNDGFIFDTILLNPMGWQIFVQDPLMRNWAFAQNGSDRIWQKIKGEVAQMKQWAQGLNNSTTATDPEQVMTTYTEIPSLFPYPLKIVVSPFIPFNGTNNTTNVILCDSSEIGIISVNEEPTTDEFDDPERDIRQVKIRERYAINLLNEGKACRQAKNVIIARSYDVDDKIHLELTGPLPTGESFSL